MSNSSARLLALAVVILAGSLTLGLAAVGLAVRNNNNNASEFAAWMGGVTLLVGACLFLREYFGWDKKGE